MTPAQLGRFPCTRCHVLRPAHALTDGACTDRKVCDRLKAPSAPPCPDCAAVARNLGLPDGTPGADLAGHVGALVVERDASAQIHDCSTATEEDFRCLDCGQLADDFWVEDALWWGAVPENVERMRDGQHTFVCLACFERRIGRRLAAADFPRCPANAAVLMVFERAQPSDAVDKILTDRIAALTEERVRLGMARIADMEQCRSLIFERDAANARALEAEAALKSDSAICLGERRAWEAERALLSVRIARLEEQLGEVETARQNVETERDEVLRLLAAHQAQEVAS